jgi:N-acetylglucosamine-6-phosphate deacetylase
MLSSMPSATSQTGIGNGITKFTNCRLVKGNELAKQDLWVSSVTGKILYGQEVFYGQNAVPDKVIDLGGRIVSPGLIDVQLNGAFGFNFSTVPEDLSSYAKSLRQVNRALIETGVTSYLPTVTSQRSKVYHKVRLFRNTPWQHAQAA